jgi:hypothetical protein
VPEHYDLTVLDPDNKLGRDIATMRADIEELHAKLARGASGDCPRCPRDHLLDGRDINAAQLVVSRPLTNS